MVRHVGHIDEIGVAGEVGSDLKEQFGGKMVEGRPQGIDVTRQHHERRTYIVH